MLFDNGLMLCWNWNYNILPWRKLLDWRLEISSGKRELELSLSRASVFAFFWTDYPLYWLLLCWFKFWVNYYRSKSDNITTKYQRNKSYVIPNNSLKLKVNLLTNPGDLSMARCLKKTHTFFMLFPLWTEITSKILVCHLLHQDLSLVLCLWQKRM